MTPVERAEARVALLRAAGAISAELRSNEREHDELVRRRAVSCRELREAGASIKELQETFGIGRSRIHQILRDQGKFD